MSVVSHDKAAEKTCLRYGTQVFHTEPFHSISCPNHMNCITAYHHSRSRLHFICFLLVFFWFSRLPSTVRDEFPTAA